MAGAPSAGETPRPSLLAGTPAGPKGKAGSGSPEPRATWAMLAGSCFRKRVHMRGPGVSPFHREHAGKDTKTPRDRAGTIWVRCRARSNRGGPRVTGTVPRHRSKTGGNQLQNVVVLDAPTRPSQKLQVQGRFLGWGDPEWRTGVPPGGRQGRALCLLPVRASLFQVNLSSSFSWLQLGSAPRERAEVPGNEVRVFLPAWAGGGRPGTWAPSAGRGYEGATHPSARPTCSGPSRTR